MVSFLHWVSFSSSLPIILLRRLRKAVSWSAPQAEAFMGLGSKGVVVMSRSSKSKEL